VADRARCLLFLTDVSELCIVHILAWRASCGEAPDAHGRLLSQGPQQPGGRQDIELPAVVGQAMTSFDGNQ
jgi:hypothetical protein